MIQIEHLRADTPPQQEALVKPEFVSIDRLAEILDLDRKTVYGAAQRRELPGCQRIGKTYRIHLPTVLSWFQADPCAGGKKRRR
jgi:excisionase family DNA binding protein